MGRFVLDPERSAALIDARSTVGPICFGTTGVARFAACRHGGCRREYGDPADGLAHHRHDRG